MALCTFCQRSISSAEKELKVTFRLKHQKNNSLSGSTNLFSLGLSVPKFADDFVGARTEKVQFDLLALF